MKIIGIGTDITETDRIADMVERHGDLFLHRVYTPHEIGYCSAHRFSTPHYAGRWAAKEAVLKAIGTGWAQGIRWVDVEVQNEAGGKPHIVITGGAKDVCQRLGIDQVLISISHCQAYATAYAVAVGNED